MRAFELVTNPFLHIHQHFLHTYHHYGSVMTQEHENNSASVYFRANIIYSISAKGCSHMDRFEQLKELTEKNNGVLRTKTVVEAGITKPVLAEFVRKNHLEKVSRGVYFSPEFWRDSLYLLQLRCPQTVFSHDTALYLLNMTDREPLQYTVTAKTGYNPSHLTAEGVKVFTVKKELFRLGVIMVSTSLGHTVEAYGPERTLCDIIRSRSSIESQIFQDSLKQYVRRRDKNLHVLMEYAAIFHVERLLRQYLEVLL